MAPPKLRSRPEGRSLDEEAPPQERSAPERLCTGLTSHARMLISLIKMLRRPTQLSLPTPRTWGGRRRGAGRKPTLGGRRPGVPHRARPHHVATYPVHVTFRATLRCLRTARVFPAVRRALAASSRADFRVVHFSVQDNHVHLLTEAAHTRALASGIRGLAIRLARAVNRAIGRRGAVWDGRYHARALRTPREVRHALVYVLMNVRKHREVGTEIDPCSSAAWFDGWHAPPAAQASGVRPVAVARTWLARVGWRRYGLIERGERPRESVS